MEGKELSSLYTRYIQEIRTTRERERERERLSRAKYHKYFNRDYSRRISR